jgi:hypothetical protein
MAEPVGRCDTSCGDTAGNCALFLCAHNAARSQMAEALLRGHAGGQLEAPSAGLEPTWEPVALWGREGQGRDARSSRPVY